MKSIVIIISMKAWRYSISQRKMAIAAAYQENMSLAQSFLEKALPLCQKVGDREMPPLLWIQTGIASYLNGDLDKALEYALEVMEGIQDSLQTKEKLVSK